MLARALARYLHTLGLVDLNEVDAGGDCFIGAMPTEPDVAVSIVPTGGSAQQAKHPTSLPRIQIRARGSKDDPIAAFERCEAIIAALVCLDGVWLDEGGVDEVWVIGVDAIQSAPAPLGMDEAGRHEYVANFELRIHDPTVHRPAIPA